MFDHNSQQILMHVSSWIELVVITDAMSVCCFSEELSRLAARKYARIIQKLGFPVSDSRIGFSRNRKGLLSIGSVLLLLSRLFFLSCRLASWNSRYRTWSEAVM